MCADPVIEGRGWVLVLFLEGRGHWQLLKELNFLWEPINNDSIINTAHSSCHSSRISLKNRCHQIIQLLAYSCMSWRYSGFVDLNVSTSLLNS